MNKPSTYLFVLIVLAMMTGCATNRRFRTAEDYTVPESPRDIYVIDPLCRHKAVFAGLAAMETVPARIVVGVTDEDAIKDREIIERGFTLGFRNGLHAQAQAKLFDEWTYIGPVVVNGRIRIKVVKCEMERIIKRYSVKEYIFRLQTYIRKKKGVNHANQSEKPS